MMKKHAMVLVLAGLVTGCSFPGAATEDQITNGVPRGEKPPVANEAATTNPLVTAEDFYFETSQNGLILKLVSDKDFSQQLSGNPIESADISDGILTFVERLGNNSQTQVFQLDALVEQMNQR